MIIGCLLALLGGGPAVLPATTRAVRTAPVHIGRALTQQLLTGDLDSLFSQLSPEVKAAVGGNVAGLRTFRQNVAALGAETALLHEAAYSEEFSFDYYRVVRFAAVEGSWTIRWVWTADGTIHAAAFFPTPAPAPSQHLGRETVAELRLPFDREWYVFWGGREPHQNYHVVNANQRFAYDFVIRRDGKSHLGDGSSNEDYYAWGAPILAPAAGTVVSAVDGIRDNTPGEVNQAALAGNHVIVDHGTGEFSLFAHLQRGSVAVKAGDRLNKGDLLGKCGNSGNTTEPHLHYHLQASGTFGAAAGLPAQFRGYRADGKPVDRGEPVRGQHIAPQ
jgi:murein DD-endopeptidase MepM/ murein hydrolase activator NlpD